MPTERQVFECTVWPHLRGAYNLARWLVGNHQDAEDVVQESFLRAFRSVDKLRGDNARAWIFTIVRNTAKNFVQRQKPRSEISWDSLPVEPRDRRASPETHALEHERSDRLRKAVERLPPEFRETLVLRELEGLPYKDIASIQGVPIGTVMSRLSRARGLLVQDLLPGKPDQEVSHELCGS